MDGDPRPASLSSLAEPPRRTRTRSTCCYCGVGCGVLIDAEHDAQGSRITGIAGDPEHPANFGRLCTKGLNLPQTTRETTGRALAPQLRRLRSDPRREVDWGAGARLLRQWLLCLGEAGSARCLVGHSRGTNPADRPNR